MADQRQDQVLGGDAGGQPALELHPHGFGPALDQRLRRQHMGQLARTDAEGQRAEPAMRAGMAVAAHDHATGQAEAEFRPDDMDDALAGLVDIEHLDAAGGGFDPQRRQQLLPDLDRAGAAMRGRDRMVRGRESQFGVMNPEVAALEVEQAARAAEIVQQMAIDMEQIGVVADMGDDMLVPDLGQHRTAGFFQGIFSVWLLRPAAWRRYPPFCTACYFRLPPFHIKAWQGAVRLGLTCSLTQQFVVWSHFPIGVVFPRLYTKTNKETATQSSAKNGEGETMAKISKVRSLDILACDAGWRNYHFVKITTEDGVVGWSEFDEGFGSPGLGTVIQRLATRVVGQNALQHERIFAELYAATRPGAGGVIAQALGAIENALLDVKAKVLGVPCYELLGGKIRDRIRVYWSHCATWRINHPTWYKPPIIRSRRRQGDRARSPREEIHRAEDQHLHL